VTVTVHVDLQFPGPSGFVLHEFEVASLGGVPGPEAIAADNSHQLFGYKGPEQVAFGEFTFNTKEENFSVIFKLINQYGEILEEIALPYRKLTP
jgi:alkaline phosphatase D